MTLPTLRARGPRRPRSLSLLAALFLLAGLASCDTEGGSGPSTPYNGVWEGATSGGGPVQFQVASDLVTMLKFEHPENGCTWKMTWNTGGELLIVEGRFVYAYDSLGKHAYLEGVFTSPGTAEGYYYFRGFADKGTTCVNRGEGTFTARWMY